MGATAHPVCYKDSFLHLFSESNFSTIFVNVSFQEGHTTISITIFGFWATRGPLSFHLKFPYYSLKVSIALGYHSANLGSLLNPTSNGLSSLPNKGTPDGSLLQPLLLRDMTHWVIISFFG